MNTSAWESGNQAFMMQATRGLLSDAAQASAGDARNARRLKEATFDRLAREREGKQSQDARSVDVNQRWYGVTQKRSDL